MCAPNHGCALKELGWTWSVWASRWRRPGTAGTWDGPGGGETSPATIQWNNFPFYKNQYFTLSLSKCIHNNMLQRIWLKIFPQNYCRDVNDKSWCDVILPKDCGVITTSLHCLRLSELQRKVTKCRGRGSSNAKAIANSGMHQVSDEFHCQGDLHGHGKETHD